MAKHGLSQRKSKRQKLTAEPLGSKATLDQLLDEESKDDEERRLESMLFGVPYVPRGSTKETRAEGGLAFPIDEDEDEEEADDGGRPMANLLDSDLFFVDDGPGPPPSQVEEEDESKDEGESEGEDSSTPPTPQPNPIVTKPSKKAAWTDPADSSLNQISLLSGPSRLRKLRLSQQEDTITEKEYESRLRVQFESINPEPGWAKRARKKNREGPEAIDNDVDDEEDDVRNLFTSTSGILKAAERRKKSLVLPSGTISIERLRDVNLAAQSAGAGEVKVVAFHPSHKVPILCVATADRRIRLYNVDGHTSPLLQTLHTASLPLTSPTSVLFHPSGSSLLLSGPRPFFFTHDLQTGLTTQHNRGLWGTTFNSSSSLDPTPTSGHKRSRNDKGSNADSIHLTSFSPTGEVLAVAAGKGALVHLVDWKSGAGQVVGSLKCTGGGSVQGLWWFDGSSGNATGILGSAGTVGLGSTRRQCLAVLTSDAEVYLWDVGERRCLRKWKDEGGFRGAGRVLAGTMAGGNGGHLSVGSSSGFVNIYSPTSFSSHPSELDKTPKPIKTIGNLTTAITALKFNHDAQLLAIASKEKKDAMRLIHLPTFTAFANWPTSSTPLGRVTAVDFSAQSEYVAIGNSRGRALLYHLREYGAGAGGV